MENKLRAIIFVFALLTELLSRSMSFDIIRGVRLVWVSWDSFEIDPMGFDILRWPFPIWCIKVVNGFIFPPWLPSSVIGEISKIVKNLSSNTLALFFTNNYIRTYGRVIFSLLPCVDDSLREDRSNRRFGAVLTPGLDIPSFKQIGSSSSSSSPSLSKESVCLVTCIFLSSIPTSELSSYSCIEVTNIL